jgi:hypothetical protein
MPRHDDPIVDTIQTIREFLTAYQLNPEDTSIEFAAVHKETSGPLSQLSEHHWQVSYTLYSGSLEEPVGDEWEAFTDEDEEFARTTYQSIVKTVQAEFPELDVHHTALLKSFCESLNRWFRGDEVEEEILAWKSHSSTSFRSVSS